MGTKFGIVLGLGAGYVLGSRAGKERYNQIKNQWLKLWNQPIVQDRVDSVKKVAADAAWALPKQLGKTAAKLVSSAAKGKTPGEKLDAVAQAAKESTPAVKRAAKKSADAVADRVEDVFDDVSDVVEDVAEKATPKRKKQ